VSNDFNLLPIGEGLKARILWLGVGVQLNPQRSREKQSGECKHPCEAVSSCQKVNCSSKERCASNDPPESWPPLVNPNHDAQGISRGRP